jgi:ribosomal protein S12 methylthiotransferase accessory factor YcaO
VVLLEVDGERHDFHRALAFALVEAAAGKLGKIELHRLVEAVDDVVHARHFADQRTVVGHQRLHDLAKHDLDHVAHAHGFPAASAKASEGVSSAA